MKIVLDKKYRKILLLQLELQIKSLNKREELIRQRKTKCLSNVQYTISDI